ncbi:integrator complex subunit 6 [Chrysoperla carnea]|uniref:integrator complex subunit 6 n=1 Tax=Chrysoperla carnea TaxID=189513 RepID=UPI001D0832F9|nr:integrator complex subunit 6 [Chrysoperla carnea]
MTIIVFLVDTSASMYQRAYLGGRPSILDVAKNAVETFVKVRQRSQESRGDRYMLLTFEEPPNNIKAGWKENLSTFMNELKNLQCLGLTSMGSALKHTFDVLNLNRMQTGIDTYGQGRCPFYLEPSVILVITDGGKLSSTTGVTDDFNLPMHTPIPGSELTREPFRWDQRLFALVLRLSGTPANERDIGLVPSDNSPIDAMCEVTGGRSYCITSHRMMMQCIDSLVQKVQSGVVINFEKIGPDPTSGDNRDDVISNTILDHADDDTENNDILLESRQILPPAAKPMSSYTLPPSNLTTGGNQPNISWHSCRKMILVPRSAQKGFAVGFWPIPESFWPDINISVLPPRSAHPNVKFTCTNQDPMVIENLPFDKYELEPSPLTQYILARKQPTICWKVFVPNSYKSSEVGHPFGYLKASTNLSCVNLFVMPYNYPVLLPLLDELFKVLRLKQTPEWTQQFRNYMRTMPSYYAGPLRRALTRMGAPNSLTSTLIPDTYDTTLSVTVLNYLKKMKNQAKIEFDRLCNDVLSKQNAQSKNQSSGAGSSRVRVLPRAGLKRDMATHPDFHDKFMSMREQLNEYGGFVVGLPASKPNLNTKSYRNPFDIHRSNLLDQVVRMRANYMQPFNRLKLVDDDVTHSLPVNQMGNYQEYLKRMPAPLREIESTPVRQHMFGNPFKIDKRMMVDEADIDLVGGNSAGSSTGSSKGGKRTVTNDFKQLPTKRKPGPIPRDVTIRRPSSPMPLTPPQSPKICDVILPLPAEIPKEEVLLSKSEDSESFDKDKITSNIDTPTILEGPNHARDFDYMSMKFDDHESINNITPPKIESPNQPSSPIQSSYPPMSDYLSPLSYNYEDVSLIINESSNSYNLNATDNTSPANHDMDKFDKKIIKNGLPEMDNTENIEPSKEDYEETIKHNIKIKRMLFADVRKPGKNYQQLLDHLLLLKGEFHQQETIIKQVYRESLRFKRENLARAINNFLQINHLESVNNVGGI